jgi:hypothetical protein
MGNSWCLRVMHLTLGYTFPGLVVADNRPKCIHRIWRCCYMVERSFDDPTLHHTQASSWNLLLGHHNFFVGSLCSGNRIHSKLPCAIESMATRQHSCTRWMGFNGFWLLGRTLLPFKLDSGESSYSPTSSHDDCL